MENEQHNKDQEKDQETNQLIGDENVLVDKNLNDSNDSLIQNESMGSKANIELGDLNSDDSNISPDEIQSPNENDSSIDEIEISNDEQENLSSAKKNTEELVLDSEFEPVPPEAEEKKSFDFSGPNQDDQQSQDQEAVIDNNKEQEQKSSSDNKNDTSKNIPDSKKSKNYFLIIAIILIIGLAIFSFWRLISNENSKNQGEQVSISVSDSLEQGKVSIIEETRDEISVLTNRQQTTDYESIEVNSFFANSIKDPDQLDCGRVFLLKRSIPKKYDSNLLNSVLGLLEPLSAKEKEAGYLSAIPDGTILKYVKLEDSGTAVVNFSGNLNKSAGSCAVTAIRAQISQTLLQFSAVKSVVICIDGNCNQDEILQP